MTMCSVMFWGNVEHDFSSQRKHSSHDESARVMVGSELSDHNDMHPGSWRRIARRGYTVLEGSTPGWRISLACLNTTRMPRYAGPIQESRIWEKEAVRCVNMSVNAGILMGAWWISGGGVSKL